MNFWRALRTLHIHLSLASFVLLLFFGITGVLLVHANSWGLDLAVAHTVNGKLPAAALQSRDRLAVVEYLRSLGAVGAVTDYSAADDELRVTFERPSQRSDAVVRLPEGNCELSLESRGAWAVLLDLHTGKAAGAWWVFIDVAGILWALVAMTGFVLWLQLKKRRNVGLFWIGFGAIASVVAFVLLAP